MLASRLAVLAGLVGLIASANAPAAPVFVLTGKGYGHGIGLSQYGTQGFAQHGWAYDEILEHYYRGAVLAPALPNDTVRVLLASGRSSLAVGSGAAFQLGGETLAAGTYTATPTVGGVKVTGNGVTRTVPSPATLAPGMAALELVGVAYRGTLLLASSADGNTLAALNVLARERYVQGVVPREMPPSWDAEALKVQAVAARTYSLAVGGHCLWTAGDAFRAATLPATNLVASTVYELLTAEPVFCSDTRDQVYGGKSAETPATNDAAQATAGEAVTHGGGIATTYFFSTSGGKTAAKADEWGGSAVPYLVSVEDPYDSISPHHAWGPKDTEADCPGTSPDCVYTAAQVRAALGLTESPRDLRVTARNASSRVAFLETTGATTSAAFTGTASRTKLKLRSTWFFVGVLSLTHSASTVTYGKQVKLAGLARRGGTSGWGTARLERKRHGEGWTPIGTALPDGAWSRTVTPRISTDYRVVSGNATGTTHRVSVRTHVTIAKPRAPFRRLTGLVQPARAGIAVTLKRKRADGTWALVAKTRTSAAGRFAFAVARPGTYRARADAGAGYLAGSATVKLPPG